MKYSLITAFVIALSAPAYADLFANSRFGEDVAEEEESLDMLITQDIEEIASETQGEPFFASSENLWVYGKELANNKATRRFVKINEDINYVALLESIDPIYVNRNGVADVEEMQALIQGGAFTVHEDQVDFDFDGDFDSVFTLFSPYPEFSFDRYGNRSFFVVRNEGKGEYELIYQASASSLAFENQNEDLLFSPFGLDQSDTMKPMLMKTRKILPEGNIEEKSHEDLL